jgi:hypothetical protein
LIQFQALELDVLDEGHIFPNNTYVQFWDNQIIIVDVAPVSLARLRRTAR